MSNAPSPSDPTDDNLLDLRDLFHRVARGLGLILGLAAIGLFLGAGIAFLGHWKAEITTTTRVTFSFDGLGKGLYPDGSKFQPDDLRAPDVVLQALRRRGLELSDPSQAQIRGGLTVDGIIPEEVGRQHDKMRASGQTPPDFVPDEYTFSLQLPRDFKLTVAERAALLSEIVSVYREKFLQTYASLPRSFGNVFEAVKDADYYEYETVLTTEMRTLIDYLDQQRQLIQLYRSPTTNLSFADLHQQARRFSAMDCAEVLGTINSFGLSRNRDLALVKLDYSLADLDERLAAAREREKVVLDLLGKVQDKGQSLVFSTMKSTGAATRPEGTLIDQNLVDSLLKNDSYNVLVKRALDAGLEAKAIEADRAHVAERRRKLAENTVDAAAQKSAMEQVDRMRNSLEKNYARLLGDVRMTREDFIRQSFADVVRITAGISAQTIWRKLALFGAIGLGMGTALGIGLSLLGIYGPARGRTP